MNEENLYWIGATILTCVTLAIVLLPSPPMPPSDVPTCGSCRMLPPTLTKETK